jgi:hypothetical protein
MKHWTACAGAAVLILMAGRPARAQQNRTPQLVPVVRYAVALAESLEVSGGALAEREGAVLWSQPSRTVQVVSRGMLTGVCGGVGISPIAAAFAPGDTVVEIVDRSAGAIWHGTANGSCIQAFNLPPAGTVVAAARCEKAWIVMLLGLDRTLRILARESSEWREQPDLSKLLPVASDGRDIHLACPGGVLMSAAVYPFDWVYVDPTARITKGRPAGMERMFDSRSATPPAVVALRMGLFESGFVQILANMRDDRRLFVGYDTGGTPVSAHTVPVPLGLLDSRLRPARALALQRFPGLGLAFMEWHWQPTNPQEREP